MKDNKGFTLIEVIFSIAFLSIVSVVILNLLVTSYQVENETDMMDMAIVHTSNEIELVKSMQISEDYEAIKYYDDIWAETTESKAIFILTVHVKQDKAFERGLYDVTANVFHKPSEKIIVDITSKHYYHEKE